MNRQRNAPNFTQLAKYGHCPKCSTGQMFWLPCNSEGHLIAGIRIKIKCNHCRRQWFYTTKGNEDEQA